MRNSLWAFILLGALAMPAAGQASPDSVHRRNECRRAVQIMRTGVPAPHREWASGYIRLCGAEGKAVTLGAIRAARNSTDRALLEDVTRPTLYLIDADFYEAAAEIAQDRSASDLARVFALRTLLVAAAPRVTPGYEAMIGASPGGNCGLAGMHDLTDRGVPLPANANQRTRALAEAIIRDQSETEPVRMAARCAAWRAGKRLSGSRR